MTLQEGMVYVGTRLDAPNGGTAPCLINSLLPVARAGDCRSRQMGYWPSYAEASPSERRAYLTWLSEGRSDPDCDIGYVFLFFYGLERRIIVDSSNDGAAKKDWPSIVRELRRLLVIYGEKSGSFRHYAGELLSWIELDGTPSGLYEKPVPDFPRTYELPPYIRLALGQASIDRAPVPAPLALAWVRLAPDYRLRTPATRCPEEFERLFTARYHDDLGPGLVLPKNRTKLRFVYRAASAGLMGTTVSMEFGGVPDVSALTRPIKTLTEIADRCVDQLASYSRLCGRDPSLVNSLECRVLLPAVAWSSEDKGRLNALIARVQEGTVTLTLRELEASLDSTGQPLTRRGVRNLAQLLEAAEVGIEPNVLGGARTPQSGDNVVLFAQSAPHANVGAGAGYQTAVLTLWMGSALAKADGKFGEQEIKFLRGRIDAWERLTLAERRRLHAHMQLLIADPPTLTGLKKKLEPLSMAERESLAAFMVMLAQSDGFVSPDEVKFLEKVYRALGIDPDRVFSDVHAAGTGGGRASVAKGSESGIHLDADRIAVLQQDTARVSAMLSEIFTEETPDQVPQEPVEPPHEEQSTLLPGLDEPHCAFARLLLTRPQWTRTELEDAAADLGLMLDGALEQINEAAFDALDSPLCEGADPIDVDTELLEKIQA
jgi:tellurite resistance protein